VSGGRERGAGAVHVDAPGSFVGSLSSHRSTRVAMIKATKKAAKSAYDTAEANARVVHRRLSVDLQLPPVAPQPGLTSMAGYLEKQQKGGTKLWQQRWFELDSVQLRYYKSSKEAEQGLPPLGLIWVRDFLAVRAWGSLFTRGIS
jgi:hypothetical protein